MALIPAGSFEMGDHLDNVERALPVHTVELDAFHMDVNEVTVGQFKQFIQLSGYNYEGNWLDVDKHSPTADHPMIYVTGMMLWPMLSGEASDYPLRPNGNMLLEVD